MPSQKSIPISELITTANSELLRLDFKRSALQIYCAEFRKFSDYYSNEKIQDYTATTGREYFQSIYGVNIASPRLWLTKSQSATRRAIRLLDDIFQFGYALRYCHRSYTVNPEYDILLESYLMKCRKKHNSQGTLRTKQMKLCQFFEYIEGRNIQLACLTSADLSNFMTTLCRCRRPTLYTTASVLKDFLRYLYESEQFTKDLSADVPKPKIYTDEDIPETWTPAEVKQLLSAVDRSNPIGKRDYAMFLLAILLGMRAGDICNLRFKNLDWNQKLITYTQQKSGKVSALPLLPVIGEAIIDYLRNGRLDSNCDNVFIRHLHPYGGLGTSENLRLPHVTNGFAQSMHSLTMLWSKSHSLWNSAFRYTIFPKWFRPLLPQNTLHPMHYAVCWLPPTLQRQRDADTLFFLRFYTTRQHV